MRGKGTYMDETISIYRITPAYAGKSFVLNFCDLCYRDHPRLCGEKFDVSQNFYMSIGSPPPMRGKAVQCETCHNCMWDHPRLCGEKFPV